MLEKNTFGKTGNFPSYSRPISTEPFLRTAQEPETMNGNSNAAAEPPASGNAAPPATEPPASNNTAPPATEPESVNGNNNAVTESGTADGNSGTAESGMTNGNNGAAESGMTNGNNGAAESGMTNGNNGAAAMESEIMNGNYTGNLKISVVSAIGLIPVENATVTIAYTGDPDSPIETLTTDNSGQTPTVKLPAPALSLSLDPEAVQQPYSEYNIFVTAEGYEPVFISGSEILAGELSLQPVRMNPVAITEDAEKIVIIPAHTLFGDYPAKIPEDEIKPMTETGEIVLSRVVIPEYVIVHDGVPSDSTATNYWVRYKDYIKNVASCEIYSTWPESSIYANILAIQSFTLNRVYTEWSLRTQ